MGLASPFPTSVVKQLAKQQVDLSIGILIVSPHPMCRKAVGGKLPAEKISGGTVLSPPVFPKPSSHTWNLPGRVANCELGYSWRAGFGEGREFSSDALP